MVTMFKRTEKVPGKISIGVGRPCVTSENAVPEAADGAVVDPGTTAVVVVGAAVLLAIGVVVGLAVAVEPPLLGVAGYVIDEELRAVCLFGLLEVLLQGPTAKMVR